MARWTIQTRLCRIGRFASCLNLLFCHLRKESLVLQNKSRAKPIAWCCRLTSPNGFSRTFQSPFGDVINTRNYPLDTNQKHKIPSWITKNFDLLLKEPCEGPDCQFEAPLKQWRPSLPNVLFVLRNIRSALLPIRCARNLFGLFRFLSDITIPRFPVRRLISFLDFWASQKSNFLFSPNRAHIRPLGSRVCAWK